MTQKTIGRYEIRKELGRGGMGAVYLAHDPVLGREVAVKLLPSYLAHEPEFSSRFAREARTVAGLDHHAIVPVHDYGEDEVWPYFVMRYMRGGSLKDRLVEGPMDLAEVNRIIFRVAGALDKAHSKGVIHRDLKPANILFDGEGQSYLADFGIVRLAEGSENFTRTGSTLGTPAYMSPEQVQADVEIDGRSDVYSLGIVLFEMLAGEPPYEDDSVFKVQTMHVSAPIPNLLELRPELPAGIQQVMDRVMAKDRDDRYQTAGALAEALEHVVDGASQVGGRPPARPHPMVAPSAERPKVPPAALVEAAAVQEPTPTPTPRRAAASQDSQEQTSPVSQPAVAGSTSSRPEMIISGANRKWLFAGVAIVALIGIVIAAIVIGSRVIAGPESSDPQEFSQVEGAPIEEPVEEPLEEPTVAPVEEPTEVPVEEPTEAPIEEPTEASNEELAADLPDLNGREVSIAVENAYLPFNYIDPETGEPAGWDYDVWNAICEMLNCAPAFVETGWDGLIESVGQGQFDVGADGITITEERSRKVDFSEPYIFIDERMLVRGDEDRFRTVSAVQADNGFVIGAQIGTSSFETAISAFGPERVVAYDSFPTAIQALISGELDVVVADEVTGVGYQGTNADQLRFVGQPIRRTSLGFVFPRGSDLVEPVNAALAVLEDEGQLEIWAEMYFTDQFTITYSDLQQ